jgi:hypothetical protein
VHIDTIQIINYILNNILSNFMVNSKFKHKDVVRSKNDICFPTLTPGCQIRNIILTQRSIEKLNFFNN